MSPTLGALAAIATTLAWALSSTRPQKLLRSLYRTGAALGIDLFRFLGASLRFRTALTAENLSSQTVGALPEATGQLPARLGSDSS